MRLGEIISKIGSPYHRGSILYILSHFSSQQPYKGAVLSLFSEAEIEVLGDEPDLLGDIKWQNWAFICSLKLFYYENISYNLEIKAIHE